MMLKNPDAQFANTSEYIENLRKQLGEVRRIEQNVTEEQTGEGLISVLEGCISQYNRLLYWRDASF